jgi:hypothetical protein
MDYDFDEQLKKGEEQEVRLDEHFAKKFRIYKVSARQQRNGIDRAMIDNKNRCWLVDYKSDFQAHETGNVFIELVSVDTTNKPGWALSSKADYIVYFMVESGTAYIVAMADILENLARWTKEYKTVECQNKDYKSSGILLPISELKRIATEQSINQPVEVSGKESVS